MLQREIHRKNETDKQTEKERDRIRDRVQTGYYSLAIGPSTKEETARNRQAQRDKRIGR